MSTGVSQINYWRPRDKATEDEATKKNNSGEGGDGAQYLSYNMFLALSIFGGFLALDHLYLRSPLTFLAKIIINILFFGIWWLYDASQAVFNRDVVKVFGLGVPGLGPKGIAAGVLANDIPDKKHLRFFTYTLALLFGGVFGLDSFLTGDKQSGFIRIISLITVIFAPIALFWWLLNLGKFFFNTKTVIEANSTYFGAPSLTGTGSSIIDKIIDFFPILAPILGPVKIVKNTVEAIATDPDIILKGPIGKAISVASEAAGPIVIPVTTAVESTAQAVSNVASAAQSSINLATATVETAKNIGQDVAQTVKPLVNLASEAAEIQAGITQSAISNAAAKALTQAGGGAEQSNTLGYVLLSALGLIGVSGFALTYRRSKENVKQSKRDDAPPVPGVL